MILAIPFGPTDNSLLSVVLHVEWHGRAYDLTEPVAIDEMKHLYVLLAGFDDDGNDTDISTGWEKNIGNRT